MAVVVVEWEEGSARWQVEEGRDVDFVLASLVGYLGEPDTIT